MDHSCQTQEFATLFADMAKTLNAIREDQISREEFAVMRADLQAIRSETTKTNGRVTALENQIHRHDTTLALLNVVASDFKSERVKWGGRGWEIAKSVILFGIFALLALLAANPQSLQNLKP